MMFLRTSSTTRAHSSVSCEEARGTVTTFIVSGVVCELAIDLLLSFPFLQNAVMSK